GVLAVHFACLFRVPGSEIPVSGSVVVVAADPRTMGRRASTTGVGEDWKLVVPCRFLGGRAGGFTPPGPARRLAATASRRVDPAGASPAAHAPLPRSGSGPLGR